MSDAQSWTLIGVFASALVAVTTLVLRTVTAETGPLGAEFGAQLAAQLGERRSGTVTQVGGLRAEMLAGFAGLRGDLDSDVGFEMRREIGDGR